tara:strand:+ start:123 stop:488 length:366 start_codon:yes stop_codon:yes gene_type:complete
LKSLGPVDYHRLIVANFCEFQGGLYGEKLNESVKVFKEFPDKDFWDWMFLNCKIKTESPLWFLSNEGMLFLKRQQKLMHCELPQSKAAAPLNEDKIGEDLKINKKNNNILDFIRDGKNKES